MTLNDKIQTYLLQKSIQWSSGDFETAQPEGEADQILKWNADKLGARPTQAQLNAAWAAKLAQDIATAYKRKRAAEYPPIGDQLDALWKGGDVAAAMLAQVQAVKAKYPKPE